MCAKLAFREKPATGLQQAILNKEARLKAPWSARLAPQMATLPSIDEVLHEIRRALRQADLPQVGQFVLIRLRCRYLPFSRFSVPFSKVKM